MANGQDRSREGRKNNTFEVLPAGTPLPDFAQVTSASVVPFNADGTILAVELDHRGLDIPGGHKEPEDGTIEDIGRRETIEEACALLADDMEVAAVIRSSMPVDGHPCSYMVVFAATVKELLPFRAAAGENSTGRRNVAPDELADHFDGHPFMREVVLRTCETRRTDTTGMPEARPGGAAGSRR